MHGPHHREPVFYDKRGYSMPQWGGIDPVLFTSQLTPGAWNTVTHMVPDDIVGNVDVHPRKERPGGGGVVVLEPVLVPDVQRLDARVGEVRLPSRFELGIRPCCAMYSRAADRDSSIRSSITFS